MHYLQEKILFRMYGNIIKQHSVSIQQMENSGRNGLPNILLTGRTKIKDNADCWPVWVKLRWSTFTCAVCQVTRILQVAPRYTHTLY